VDHLRLLGEWRRGVGIATRRQPEGDDSGSECKTA
jgi:hypothetical protein